MLSASASSGQLTAYNRTLTAHDRALAMNSNEVVTAFEFSDVVLVDETAGSASHAVLQTYEPERVSCDETFSSTCSSDVVESVTLNSSSYAFERVCERACAAYRGDTDVEGKKRCIEFSTHDYNISLPYLDDMDFDVMYRVLYEEAQTQ